MPEYVKIIIYAIISFVPYAAIALILFRNKYRFNTLVTHGVVTLLLALNILLPIAYAKTEFNLKFSFDAILISVINCIVFSILFKFSITQVLYNYFKMANISFMVYVLIVVSNSVINSKFYPILHPLLFTIIVVIFAFVFRHIKKSAKLIKSVELVNDYASNDLWNYLWLIPTLFFLLIRGVFYILYEYGLGTTSGTLKSESMVFTLSVFFMIIAAIQIITYYTVYTMLYNKIQLQRQLYERKLLDMQTMQLKQLEEYILNTRKLIHDARHHVLVVNSLLDAKDYDSVRKYVTDYFDSLSLCNTAFNSNNMIFNAILLNYTRRAKENRIQFSSKMQLPQGMFISDSDITILFSNLFENSFYACENMPEGMERKITVSSINTKMQFAFSIKNTYTNSVTINENGEIMSTKHSGTGVGLVSIKAVVEKYGGTMYRSSDGKVFTVDIFIPLQNIQHEEENLIENK